MGKKFLELCEEFFGTRDFYKVLNISKTADEKEVKKAYHKLSLLVHPDRVEEAVKEEATEKFKVLGMIHSILSDKDKRQIYDETGQYDDDDEEAIIRNWADYWGSLFKKITVKDINEYEKNYKGSETEIKDLKRAYMNSKGNMDYILESVPFTNCEEEPRLKTIIQDLIDKGEVPEYKEFTEENEKKKLKRKRKWEKEAQESSNMNDLVQMIQKKRTKSSDNFLDHIIEKYDRKTTPKRKASASRKKKT